MAIGGTHTVPRGLTGGARPVGEERLPCGRRLRDVWERSRDGHGTADAHAAGCPYCRQAAAGLARLDRVVRALRADRARGHPVAERVMRAVRAETRVGRLVPLDDAAGGLRIAEAAAAKVLRCAVDAVPGVHAASCRLIPTGGGPEVGVSLTLASTLDTPLPEKAAAVRRAVAGAARTRLGIDVARVDVTFASVIEPEPPGASPPAREGPGA